MINKITIEITKTQLDLLIKCVKTKTNTTLNALEYLPKDSMFDKNRNELKDEISDLDVLRFDLNSIVK